MRRANPAFPGDATSLRAWFGRWWTIPRSAVREPAQASEGECWVAQLDPEARRAFSLAAEDAALIAILHRATQARTDQIYVMR